MLVPDTPQPSLELVTVLFSPKAPFRGQRLFASITVCSQSSMCAHTHAHPKSRCVSGQGALPVLKNPTEKPLRTEERKAGVELNRLVLLCLVQAPWVFFQWKKVPGDTGREGQGERERCEGWRSVVVTMISAPLLSALCVVPCLGWCVCWGIPPSAVADVMDGILRTKEPWLHSLDRKRAQRPDSGIWRAVFV